MGHAGRTLGLVFLVISAGCDSTYVPDPGAESSLSGAPWVGLRLETIGGDNQVGAPDTVVARPLTVRVLGPRRVDFMGRRRERQPAVGIPVRFRVARLKEIERRESQAPKKEQERRKATQQGKENREEEKKKAEAKRNEGPTGATDSAGVARSARQKNVDVKGKRAQDVAANPSEYSQPPLQPRSPLLFTTRDNAKNRIEGVTKDLEVVTDSSGVARVFARLGTLVGDWRIAADLYGKKDVHFRLTSGVVTVYPNGNEAPAGTELRLRLDLYDWDEENTQARPLSGREVVLSVVDEPDGTDEGAELPNRTDTTKDGQRSIRLTLGERPGKYRVLAEITPEEEDILPWRGIVFTVLATDWVNVGIQFVVGVLLFVIGVRLLGSGGLLLTSRYLHLPTESWSRNRISGFFGGTLAGVVFQSSSSVCSYLRSLTNSGILKAKDSLGLILGASVGGTALCQILALDLSQFAAPMLAIGTFLFLVRRHRLLGSWAWIFVGSGLVLVSWSILGESLDTASLSDQLQNALRIDANAHSKFSDHSDDSITLPSLDYVGTFFVYFAVAALVALCGRSASLVVVLTMFLAAHRIITTDAVAPLIVGANLGAALQLLVTTLTNRFEARRFALLNLLVHAFGSIVAAILALVALGNHSVFISVVDWIVPGRFLSPVPGNIAQHVATAHTLYNVFVSVVLLLIPTIVFRPLGRLLPERRAGEHLKPIHLDDNLINVPALALRQTTVEVIYMTEVSRKTVAEAFDSLRYDDLGLSGQVTRREQLLDDLQREVSQYLSDVCRNQLAHRDVTRLQILQTTAESMSRIAAYAEDVRQVAARKIDDKIPTSEEVARDLNEVYELVVAQFDNILQLLRKCDLKTEESAVKMVERLAKYSSRIGTDRPQHTAQSSTETLTMADHLQVFVYQEAFSLLFQIGSELAHVAERMRLLAPSRD